MSITHTPRDRANAHDMDPDPYTQTVARLAREFAGSFSEPGIEMVLDGCIEDLSGVPSAAMPEMSERLAQERITSYCRSRDRDFTGSWRS
ncbi:hypothetical protein R4P64_30315 [Rhodococcus sp. IEGM 1366]|uniref:hypothetical protein n=1 Tax=Rhodococcus sp. IEGM 1366 TaxID=3082223 RepID=UPI002954BFCB|nr:hypothetical protein [Rhodococcus sp. IEGM 1366]MDV8070822.1 hypothetical protein [Rhodococcus sp. IEGM 1366]